jgi:hypothetical protein
MSWKNGFLFTRSLYSILALTGVLLLMGNVAQPAEQTGQHYKMLSAVDYSGQEQFKNHVETQLTVRKQPLADDKVRYLISSNEFDLSADISSPAQQSSSKEISFIIDTKTGFLSQSGSDLTLIENINNQCIRSLKKVSGDKIGKSWKQTFSLSSLVESLPGQMSFTLTAIGLKTQLYGDMLAVRALSEPFIVRIPNTKGGVGQLRARISAVYLFEPNADEVYMSISVFEATTDVSGFAEKLRCEVATYRTDAAGQSLDFSGLGREFEKLVQSVGLSDRSIKIVKETPLPKWVRSGGLSAAQVSNACAAIACEGAVNPVASIYIPAARTLALQTAGRVASMTTVGTVSGVLATKVTGIAGMKIAVAPAVMGMGLGTAGAVAGVGAGAVAIAGGAESGGHGENSPTTP